MKKYSGGGRSPSINGPPGYKGLNGCAQFHCIFTNLFDNNRVTLAHLTSSSQIPANRRGAQRYEVTATLQYRVRGRPEWRRGNTLNMSTSGILVQVGEVLPAGCRLEMRVDWPGLCHRRSAIDLAVTASVVRVDGRGTALRVLRQNHVGILVNEHVFLVIAPGFVAVLTIWW